MDIICMDVFFFGVEMNGSSQCQKKCVCQTKTTEYICNIDICTAIVLLYGKFCININ